MNREEEREREAKRLKEFLEDYEDERDDSKYYKGRELQRRLAERVREADLDAKDRDKEQEELDELKHKIFSGEFANPTLEFERLKREREDLYRPKILIDVNLEQSQQRERELERERERDMERQKVRDRERIQKERYIVAQASRELAAINAEPIDSDSSNDGHFDNGEMDGNDYDGENQFSTPPLRHSHHNHSHHRTHNNSNTNSNNINNSNNNDRHSSHRGSESRDINNLQNDEDSRHSMLSVGGSRSPSILNHASSIMPDRVPSTPPVTAPLISLNLGAANAKKKKLEVTDIFNNDDDNEDVNGPKKRKLVPLGNLLSDGME